MKINNSRKSIIIANTITMVVLLLIASAIIISCRILLDAIDNMERGNAEVLAETVGSEEKMVYGPPNCEIITEPEYILEDPDVMFEENLEEICLVATTEWNWLSVQRKTEVLQIFADMERCYFGMKERNTVVPLELEPGVLGQYSDTTKSIEIDSEKLETRDARELVNAVCHESYHSYECRLIETFDLVPYEYQQLRVFLHVKEYKEEFENYISSTEDAEAYRAQVCEESARSYAEKAENYYYKKIKEYMDNAGG